MGTKIKKGIGVGFATVDVFPTPVKAQRAPASTDTSYPAGQIWVDESASPVALYTFDGNSTWQQNQLTLSTDGTFAAASDTTASSSLAIKTYVDATASFGAPIATESTQGIGELATDTEAINGTASTASKALFVTPSNLTPVFASPPAIGGTAAAAGTFTGLTADGTGTVTLTSNAASVYDVTGAGNDLTLSSDAGRVIVNGEEAAANAITLLSAAGGIDADAALQINIASSQNAGDAVRINASAGGIDIDAAGAAGEDITIDNAAGSVSISSGESAADAIKIESTAGGIDILASGAAAGEDIDITATGSSVNISSTEAVANAIRINASAGGVDLDAVGQVNIASSQNAGDAVRINASAGGIDIDAAGAAGEDITIDNAAGSITLTAGEAAADAIGLQSTGGLDVDTALELNLTSSQSAATAINMNASDAAGGITMAAGTGGILIGNQADCTTIDVGDLAPTASRTITVGGGTVVTAAVTDLIDIAPDGATTNADSIKQVDVLTGTVATGQSLLNLATGAITSGTHTVSIQSGNAAAGTVATNISTGTGTKTVNLGNADAGTTFNIDAVTAINNNVNANFSVNDGTSTGTITIGNGAAGAVTVDSGSGISLDAAAASNFNVTGATNDLTLGSAGGRVIVDAGEDAADAIYLHANAGTSETIRLHSDQGTGADSVHLESDVGGVTLTSGLASADAINLSASAGGVDIDGALQVNIASSQADSAAITLSASNASGGITHTGRCIFTPDAITSDNAGVAASVSTFLTQITTDGDSNEDNVTLADGVDGQIKMFAVVAAGNAADSVKITPANMAGGTKITFAADPTGLGCTMAFDGTNWTVVANNGGTIA